MDILIIPVINILLMAIQLYIYAVIISAVLSWLVAFNVVNPSNRIVHIIGDTLHRLTEPALRPIRNLLPDLGGIDLSPVVLILGLILASDILSRLGQSLAG